MGGYHFASVIEWPRWVMTGYYEDNGWVADRLPLNNYSWISNPFSIILLVDR